MECVLLIERVVYSSFHRWWWRWCYRLRCVVLLRCRVVVIIVVAAVVVAITRIAAAIIRFSFTFGILVFRCCFFVTGIRAGISFSFASSRHIRTGG